MSKAIVTEYYNHLSNKNLDGLKGLFNDSIELQSPTLTTDGVTAVGNGFTELFNSVTTIQVVSATMYEDGNTVVSETNFQIVYLISDIQCVTSINGRQWLAWLS